MTAFDVARLEFNRDAVARWDTPGSWHSDWPVVYVLDSGGGDAAQGLPPELYVGETLNARNRLRQHLDSGTKASMRFAHVLHDAHFNKSAALDLESYLIRLFAGDGRFSVLNRNDGIIDGDYFDRAAYRASFGDVFESLKVDGLFTRDIAEIENDDLFKLSPFKALTADQLTAVEQIMRLVTDRLLAKEDCTVVVRGAPGTGKTIVGIYLMKLIADLGRWDSADDATPESESPLSALFTDDTARRFRGLHVGMVVPQQSLRTSVQRVFRKTPGLASAQALSPFSAAETPHGFEVLIVDEAHRLNLRANQPSARQNARFADVNRTLFGADDHSTTQLDWIAAKSRIRILLLDERQSVMPADLDRSTVSNLIAESMRAGTYFVLRTQMRVRGGGNYVDHVRRLLDAEHPPSPLEQSTRAAIDGYEIKIFDDIRAMHDAVRRQDGAVGLSRLVAGYAWKWRSKHDPSATDISIDGYGLQWNRVQVDWINSANSVEQVGSIHTVQGYDLNYAGVIVGPDLRMDPTTGRLRGDRASYFDVRGKHNNRVLRREYSDDDLTRFIADIYGVLLTRGILGTYLYVVDPTLRAYLRAHL